MIKVTLSLFCFLFVALITLANNEDGRGTIRGKVTDANGEPAVSVFVLLKASKRGTVTDENGYFEFKRLKPGNYILQISLTGHESLEQIVEIKENQTADLNFQLQLSAKELYEVIVVGGKNKFSKKESNYSSRMPLSYLENPQVYNVVTKELLQEQVNTDFRSTFKNIPGVSSNGGNHSSNGRLYTVSRGFNTGNGVRNGMVSASVSEIDPVNLERLEAVKGPSGTLFGSNLSTFGGLFNRVMKKPLDYFKGEAAYTFGSWGLNRLMLDINTPLNESKDVLMRLNAAVHSERSFQDFGFFKTYTFAPSFTFKVSDRLTINLDAEFYSRNGTPVFGNSVRYANVTAKSADQLKLDYDRSYINNSINAETRTQNIFAEVNYKISDQWVYQTNFSFASCKFYYPAVNAVTLNDSMMYRNIRNQYTHQNNNQIQQNLIGTFNIGNMKNELLLGADVQYGRYDFPDTRDFPFDTLNYLTPGEKYTALNVDDLNARIAGQPNVGSASGSESAGVYASDVLNITDRLSIMASLRFEWYRSIGNYSYATDLTTGAYEQNALSPKLGIVYQLVQNQVSLFANYMNAFSPVSGLDFNGNSFRPQYANQAEAGVKIEMLNGKLTSTISYYDISVTNTLRTDTENAGYSIQNGTQKSKGFELEIISNPIRGFNILLGYAYNDSKLVKANENVEGKRPTGSGAANTANCWVSYKFLGTVLKGLGLGIGGNYSGHQYISNTTTALFTIPEYTTIDATVFYDFKTLRLSAKADNLTSEKYWSQYTMAPMPPARYSLSVAVPF